MATIGAQLTENGILVPDYADILQELKIQFWQIYGSDADLDANSPDGQWVAVLAQIIYDAGLLAQAAYQGFSPATAQGVQLSSVVKINGLKRDVSTNSTVNVVVTGAEGTQILNGVIGDNQNLGTKWSLPASVVIDNTGAVTVTATCTAVGAVSAAANTLVNILTPTQNWQSVTNPQSATLGAPNESDSQLRVRQSNSTSIPALSVLDSVTASVAAVTGVQRVAPYENDNDIADSNGLPPHSISMVVSGGDATDIANAIAIKKTPGTRAYGSTIITIIDPAGVPNSIGFYELTNIELVFEVDIHALTGFISTTESAIQDAVVAFINALAIGEDSYLTRLYVPANLGGVGLGATFVVTAVKQAIKGNALGTADIAIAFNAAAFTQLSDVTIVVS